MRIYLVRPSDVYPPVWYGVSRYTTCLVEAMHRLDPALQFVASSYSVRGRVDLARREVLERAGVELLTARFPDLSSLNGYQQMVDRWIAPRLVERAGCDLAWGTNCVTLRKGRRRYRTAMTIHDLFLLTHPELAETRFTALVAPKLRRAAQRTDVIVTVSRFTARQIVEMLGVPEEKVAVTYAGCALPETAGAADDPAAILAEYGLTEPPILSVGTVEPRKNYERGFESYVELERRLGGAPPWVIVGRDGWKFDGIYAARRRLGIEDRVRVLHGVGDEQLVRLYRVARCLFYPSLTEGFGLPVLEAMKLGLPVVLSTGGSLPEVGGDAVLYVDPLDPRAMAEGLAQILDDTSLAAELSAKGRVQARRFTWDQAARSTLEAFRQAIG